MLSRGQKLPNAHLIRLITSTVYCILTKYLTSVLLPFQGNPILLQTDQTIMKTDLFERMMQNIYVFKLFRILLITYLIFFARKNSANLDSKAVKRTVTLNTKRFYEVLS